MRLTINQKKIYNCLRSVFVCGCYLREMKSASSGEIKQELKKLPQNELLELCLRLVRFKKENKELLSFLLFESNDIEGYIKSCREEMDELFETVNTSHLYFAKKTIRKILRLVNKQVRHSSNKQVEVELLLHFCSQLQSTVINYTKSPALFKLYLTQIKKLRAVIESLHEDLQFDYLKELNRIAND
jgi:hypothetical protein